MNKYNYMKKTKIKFSIFLTLLFLTSSVSYSQEGFKFETDFKYATSQNSNNIYSHFFYLSGNINYSINNIIVGIKLPFVSQGTDTYKQVGTIILKESGLNHSSIDSIGGHIQTSLTDGVAINNLKIGFGDIVLNGSLELLDNKNNLTSVYVKSFIKIPTAVDKPNIGTGKLDMGFALAIKKLILGLKTYSSVGYLILGNYENHILKNPLALEFSIGKSFSNNTFNIYLQFEGYTNIIENYTPPRELSILIDYLINKTTSITFKTSTGISSSSPDFIFESTFNINI